MKLFSEFLKGPTEQTQTGSSTELPNAEQVKAELERVNERKRFRGVFNSTVYALITVAAIAVLVATLLLPVLQIYGTSMTPTLTEKDIVISVKGSNIKQGQIVAFYYNNKILVKRAIAFEGDWVDIDDKGIVTVNGKKLDEPYVHEHALGDCNITLPYQVPDGKVFVMGDHRATSQDSRTKEIGCVSEEQIVGHITFCVWPLKDIGAVK